MNLDFNKNRNIAIVLAVFLFLLLAFFLDPSESLFSPKCFFYYTAAVQCPGCGAQRAIHALLHLRFAEAFHYNALLVVLSPYLIVGAWLEFFGGKRRYPRLYGFLFNRIALWIVVGLVVGFTLWRL